MKKKLVLLLLVFLTIVIAACGPTIDLEAETASEASEEVEDPKKIGLVIGTSGLGDQNFNDMIYGGLVKAEEELGITFDYSEPSTAGDIVTMVEEFAQDGSYDLIIIGSSEGAAALTEIAPEYPNQKFTVIDTFVEGDNIRSVLKNGAEQTFLAGVAAGALTQVEGFEKINDEKVIGALIGQDFPVVRAMAAGFTAGAYYVDPEIVVLHSTVGAWNDPGTAKEMTIAMIEQGGDIFQNIAGGSGTGIYAAVEEKGALAVGVGANQNHMSDHIIGTALFVLNQYVYNESVELVNGTWTSGLINPGIASGSLGFETEGSAIELPQEVLDKVEAAKEWLVSNGIVLPVDPADVESWGAKTGLH